ncbi:MAG: hypothetical protein J7M11_02660 [Elusimicrobia bacterium]|nr:hypothetical protein [Elusimicrobiota bacterium]
MFCCCAAAIVLTIGSGVFAYEEDAESSVVTTDPVIWQQTSVDMVEPTPSAGDTVAEEVTAPQGVETGMQMIIADKTKVIILPLSYILPIDVIGGKLSLGAGIPWVSKTVTNFSNAEETKSGLGDISLKATHDYGDEVYFRRIISVIVKLPTGDEAAKLSDTTPSPLGKGSLDYAFAFSGIRRIGSFRIIGNAGYRLNGDFEDTANSQTTSYGNVINLLAGTEYKLNSQLFPFAYVRMVETGEAETVWSGGSSKNQDDVTAIDLITGARYKLLGSVSLSGALEFPVARKYNPAVTAPPNKVALTLKANYKF